MRTLVDAVPGTSAPLFVALLSGSFTQAEDFIREGFIAALRERGIGAEVAMSEVHAAYFADGSIVQRIHDGVVGPARQRGATRVWLAGISLGALASLAYAARHEEELEGMLLMSPYPGTRILQGDIERDAWQWLSRARDTRLDVHCYYGTEDRFVEGQRRIAQALPTRAVREMAGGHEWKDWRRMWKHFLESETLQ